MTKFLRRGVAVVALWAGILGLLLGFGFWLQPENTARGSPELALLVIALGLIAWSLGCRLAVAAPRQVRHEQKSQPVDEEQGTVLDPPAAVLRR